MDIILNEGQQAVVEAILSGVNVFLSGEAGTGKSTAIMAAHEALTKRGKQIVCCAPTGIAALNVQGVTIHSAFRINPSIPLIGDNLMTLKVSKLIKAADVVIIDEISMVRRDLMDAVAHIIIKENERRKDKAAIQVITVGDFCQLPPVVTDNEKEVLEKAFNICDGNESGFFAFQADGWRMLNLQPYFLTKPMRQKDPELLHNLNLLREGNAECVNYFKKFVRKAPDNVIHIVSRNKDAQTVNDRYLEDIDSPPKKYSGTITGDFNIKEAPVPRLLYLKVGARVMCMANNTEQQYVNGALGVVRDLNAHTADGKRAVQVELDSGVIVNVVNYTWVRYRYNTVTDRDGKMTVTKEPTGTYSQIALKLAWAITYHKSQGQTFDSLCIDPSTFSDGMLYVGMSRATCAEGIYLTRPIRPADIRTSQAVIKFHETFGTPHDYEKIEIVEPVIPAAIEIVQSTADAAQEIVTIQQELHNLCSGGKRTWGQVYELLERVDREELYKPCYKNYTQWLEAQAAALGVSVSLLRRQKRVGKSYEEWRKNHPEAPSIAEGKYFSIENLDLIIRIIKMNPTLGDQLMQEIINRPLSTEELYRKWDEERCSRLYGNHTEDSVQASKQITISRKTKTITIKCTDAGTFERILKSLNDMGI